MFDFISGLMIILPYNHSLFGYYVVVGIVGLIMLAILIWEVIITRRTIKTNERLREQVRQLQKQLHQVDNTTQSAYGCLSSDSSAESHGTQTSDPNKSHHP